jgi:hypothetical protein
MHQHMYSLQSCIDWAANLSGPTDDDAGSGEGSDSRHRSNGSWKPPFISPRALQLKQQQSKAPRRAKRVKKAASRTRRAVSVSKVGAASVRGTGRRENAAASEAVDAREKPPNRSKSPDGRLADLPPTCEPTRQCGLRHRAVDVDTTAAAAPTEAVESGPYGGSSRARGRAQAAASGGLDDEECSSGDDEDGDDGGSMGNQFVEPGPSSSARKGGGHSELNLNPASHRTGGAMGPTNPSTSFSSSGERSQWKRQKVSAGQRNVLPANPPASLRVAMRSDTGHCPGMPDDERELSRGSGPDDVDNGSEEGRMDEDDGEDEEEDKSMSGGGRNPSILAASDSDESELEERYEKELATLREQHKSRINEQRSELTKKLNEERAAWTNERQAKQGELDACRDQLTSATTLLNDERTAWADERAAWASERQTKQGELDACRDKLATMEAEIEGLKSRGVQGTDGQPIQEEIFYDAHM